LTRGSWNQPVALFSILLPHILPFPVSDRFYIGYSIGCSMGNVRYFSVVCYPTVGGNTMKNKKTDEQSIAEYDEHITNNAGLALHLLMDPTREHKGRKTAFKVLRKVDTLLCDIFNESLTPVERLTSIDTAVALLNTWMDFDSVPRYTPDSPAALAFIRRQLNNYL
jgi:hypothetical protein